jgi:hypothetical protein
MFPDGRPSAHSSLAAYRLKTPVSIKLPWG